MVGLFKQKNNALEINKYMASTVILTSQPAATLSVVPNQNTTFTVAASANFNVSSFTYQWKKAAAGGAIGSATNISGATNPTYAFEPAAGDNGYAYYCTVNGLSATSTVPTSQASVNSTGLVLTVASDSSVFARHAAGPVDAANPSKESGAERFRRIRHLGYC